MFSSIVVGMDGLGVGDDAVALARVLGRDSAKLTLAHVVTSGRPTGDANGAIDELQPLEQLERAVTVLGEARAKELSRHIGVEITVQSTGREWLANGLCEIAQAEEADLVVIGSSHQALARHVLLSDETQSALNGLPCSVAVAPAAFGRGLGAIHRVGVGTDGSDEAVHAVEFARAVAEKHDARLFACTAISGPMPAVSRGSLPIAPAIRDLERLPAQRILPSYHTEAQVAYGPPAEVLAKFSRALDLLVIGSRDGGKFGEVALGETFNELTKHARCPVLVPPRKYGMADR